MSALYEAFIVKCLSFGTKALAFVNEHVTNEVPTEICENSSTPLPVCTAWQCLTMQGEVPFFAGNWDAMTRPAATGRQSRP